MFGMVIEVMPRKIIATLTDVEGRAVPREKLLERNFRGAEVVAAAACWE